MLLAGTPVHAENFADQVSLGSPVLPICRSVQRSSIVYIFVVEMRSACALPGLCAYAGSGEPERRALRACARPMVSNTLANAE